MTERSFFGDYLRSNLSFKFFYDRNQCIILSITVWEPLISRSELMKVNLGNQSL